MMPNSELALLLEQLASELRAAGKSSCAIRGFPSDFTVENVGEWLRTGPPLETLRLACIAMASELEKVKREVVR
jgi:hypothetical protein